MNADKRYLVGVDVGGTFTDLCFLNEETGACEIAKVPSTREDQSIGIRNGIAKRLDNLSSVATVIHGTTIGTNALLERKGAKTGVITTAGFRDVLEMRRRDRPRTWGLWGMFNPIVPRDLRLEVKERVLADGTIHTPVDIDAVCTAAETLLSAGAEALCIFFINSYANDANERAAFEALRDRWPNSHITTSSGILPEIREFERASTAALNAYLQPVIGNYLEHLQKDLVADGFGGEVLIVQSNGGVMSANTARKLPVRTALSGPAAGVIAGAYIANSAGFPNIITCDMGGTSFDVSLVADGKSELAAQTSVDFGLVVRTPMIEITTISAGGGSIAWVDRGGLLEIGPESAGSDPGPVCYGLGNDRPTVTDANVVLGRINANRPIGGKIKSLDRGAAEKAIAATIGEPLGLSPMEAAEAIIRVANAKMAGAIRLVSVERGHNPKKFAAMPFGGGGALHAGALIKNVGLSQAIVPRYPGITSALGCIVADMRHDHVATINRSLDELEMKKLSTEIKRFGAEGTDLLRATDVQLSDVETLAELDMLYLGQTHTVAVPLSTNDVGLTREAVRLAFEQAYINAYGRLLDGLALRVVNLRVAVVGRRPDFDLKALAPCADQSTASITGTRTIWADGGKHEANVFDRLSLAVGADVPGPAILEQTDATTYIDPDLTGRVDEFGNLIISRKDI